jgi:hypothetical protein
MEEIMFKKIILATLVLTIVNPVAFAEKAKKGSKLETACAASLSYDMDLCNSMPGAYSVPHPPAIDKCIAKAGRDYQSCITYRSNVDNLNNLENAVENPPENSIQFDSQN